jgi:hypothetical protein
MQALALRLVNFASGTRAMEELGFRLAYAVSAVERRAREVLILAAWFAVLVLARAICALGRGLYTEKTAAIVEDAALLGEFTVEE